MKKNRRGRYRLYEVEHCHSCGACRGEKCKDYRGVGKAPCFLNAICHRCAAQPKECNCGVVKPLGKLVWPYRKRDEKGQLLLFGHGPEGVEGGGP